MSKEVKEYKREYLLKKIREFRVMRSELDDPNKLKAVNQILNELCRQLHEVL